MWPNREGSATWCDDSLTVSDLLVASSSHARFEFDYTRAAFSPDSADGFPVVFDYTRAAFSPDFRGPLALKPNPAPQTGTFQFASYDPFSPVRNLAAI